MTAREPGQAEYETWRDAVPDYVCNVPAGPWDELPPTIQAGFAALAAREPRAASASQVRRHAVQARAADDADGTVPDSPVCPRDHWKLGRDLPMDRVLTAEGGWECPGIRPDRSGGCGFRIERLAKAALAVRKKTGLPPVGADVTSGEAAAMAAYEIAEDYVRRLEAERDEARAAARESAGRMLEAAAENERLEGRLRETAAGNIGLRELVREILREVELGTLGQHTAQATARTLARTAAWRERARELGGA